MKILTTVSELANWRSVVDGKNQTLAFVPTMGALHEGHGSLIQKAQKKADSVLVSLFVNPLQFNNQDDLAKYPRMIDTDLNFLKKYRVNAVFAPNENEMFPENLLFPNIELPQYLRDAFCSPFRSGHFNGVAKIIWRFFTIIRPKMAFFGWKDFQQCKVVEFVNQKFNLEIDLHFCATVREKTGLAHSSRNQLLSEEGKLKSAKIWAVLQSAARLIEAERELWQVLAFAKDRLTADFRVEYVDARRAGDLAPLRFKKNGEPIILATAVYCENIRLIDSILIV